MAKIFLLKVHLFLTGGPAATRDSRRSEKKKEEEEEEEEEGPFIFKKNYFHVVRHLPTLGSIVSALEGVARHKNIFLDFSRP
jgi:hypothetical protein